MTYGVSYDNKIFSFEISEKKQINKVGLQIKFICIYFKDEKQRNEKKCILIYFNLKCNGILNKLKIKASLVSHIF